MSDRRVQELLDRGALRRVEPDGAAAGGELATAKQHLASAQRISDDDEAGALAIAYEAARKAIGAHMRANGLRVPGSEGGHARTGDYGVAAFDDPVLAEHFRAFGDVRKLRNRSQYDAVPVEEADVEFALEHARSIVAAIEADLS
jgi:hypothetical protein